MKQGTFSDKAIKEKSYDELSEKDLYELAAYDNYFDGEPSFDVQGKEIVVKGDMLAAALENFRRTSGILFCFHILWK